MGFSVTYVRFSLVVLSKWLSSKLGFSWWLYQVPVNNIIIKGFDIMFLELSSIVEDQSCNSRMLLGEHGELSPLLQNIADNY